MRTESIQYKGFLVKRHVDGDTSPLVMGYDSNLTEPGKTYFLNRISKSKQGVIYRSGELELILPLNEDKRLGKPDYIAITQLPEGLNN